MRSFSSSALVAVITFFTVANAASPPSFGEARSASWYKPRHVHKPRHFVNTTIKSEITTTESKTKTALPITMTDLNDAVSSPSPKSEETSTSESTSPAYIPYPIVTISEDSADPSIESKTTEYTTSTIFTTKVNTITSCAPTVTNCPVGSVTTEIIPLYTTVCPIGEKPSPSKTTDYMTSTAYTTKYETITSCAPEVTNCPAESTIIVTKTSALYTVRMYTLFISTYADQ